MPTSRQIQRYKKEWKAGRALSCSDGEDKKLIKECRPEWADV